jgi:hypothetical protein
VGFIASLGVAIYWAVRVNPSARYLAFYVLMLAMTYMLTSRIAVAVVQGYYRSRGSISRPEEPAQE